LKPVAPSFSNLARTVAIALVALLAAPAAALAQCPQTTLGEIESEVMCPVCGTPLALATEAPQAQEQREFITQRIERCQSEDEIKAALVAEFGEGVLSTPGDDGVDLAAYLLPGLAVLAGAGGIALATVRWRRARGAAADGSVGEEAARRESNADSERLAADLERYDL
jgi:cytochrome c-type biogenesis protein CcmH